MRQRSHTEIIIEHVDEKKASIISVLEKARGF